MLAPRMVFSGLAVASALIIVRPLSAEWMLGLRTWQASWSPGIMRKVKEEDSNESFWSAVSGNSRLAYVPFASDSVSGIYSGPLVNYISDSKKWSFSFVGLRGASGVQSFTQLDFSEFTNGTTTIGQNDARLFQTTPTRNDLDANVGYSFAEHWKVFAGGKLQSYDYDSETNLAGSVFGAHDFGAGAERFSSVLFGVGNQRIKHSYRGPTAGLAYAHPISETGSLSISVGFFRASGDIQDSATRVTVSQISSSQGKASFVELSSSQVTIPAIVSGVTMELTYTAVVTDLWLLQMGYRGQRSTLRTDSAFSTEVSLQTGINSRTVVRPFPLLQSKFDDRFQGLSFSIIRRFQ